MPDNKKSKIDKKTVDSQTVANKSKKSWWKKWRQLKKRWKFLIILALIIIIWTIVGQIFSQKKQADNREIVSVEIQNLQKEAIRSGQVELQGVVEVTPPINGVISELLVDNGQYVTEGEELFQIKSNATTSQISQAWANYLSAKNTYENAQITIGDTEWSNFESYKKAMMDVEEKVRIFEENYPEKMTVDNKEYQSLKLEESVARRNLDIATLYPDRIDERLDLAKAEFQAAASAYNATKDGTYESPISGWIQNLGVNEGEKVIADVGDKKGTPLFLIVPEGKKTISMQIGPSDAMILAVGQTATVKNDYIKDVTFPAQIVRIDKVGQTSTDKGLVYRAWLEVDDSNDQLLLGVPVEISIITATRENVIVVPSTAVHDNQVTIVDKDGHFIEERAVTTDLKANGMTEVTSGLSVGEAVLIDHNL